MQFGLEPVWHGKEQIFRPIPRTPSFSMTDHCFAASLALLFAQPAI